MMPSTVDLIVLITDFQGIQIQLQRRHCPRQEPTVLTCHASLLGKICMDECTTVVSANQQYALLQILLPTMVSSG